jgi:hypothetical protein
LADKVGEGEIDRQGGCEPRAEGATTLDLFIRRKGKGGAEPEPGSVYEGK